MPPLLRWAPRAACLLLIASTGCEDRVAECRSVVDRLDPHTATIEARVEALAAVEREPSRLDALRTALDEADHGLAVLQLEDRRLAGLVLRFRRGLADGRKAADALQTAMSGRDPAGLNDAAKSADAFVDAQAEIAAAIRDHCGPPAGADGS